jgi:hypothetical protein
MGPVVEDLAEVAAVAEGKVHALWLCPDFVPSYAGLADGGGIDEGCQFLNMLVMSCQRARFLALTLMFSDRSL